VVPSRATAAGSPAWLHLSKSATSITRAHANLTSIQPEHASLWISRQISDYLEPHSRRASLRIPKAKSSRSLSYRFRLCMNACPSSFVLLLIEDRSSHLTAPTLFPHPGTRPYVSGNLLLATQPAPSLVTPMMSSQYPSPQTTVRSSQDRAIEQSSYGTL
jgi:hypothetical protein